MLLLVVRRVVNNDNIDAILSDYFAFVGLDFAGVIDVRVRDRLQPLILPLFDLCLYTLMQ